MKKILIRLAAGLVLDVLEQYAFKQLTEGGSSAAHIDRWNTIVRFLQEMKAKGLPL